MAVLFWIVGVLAALYLLASLTAALLASRRFTGKLDPTHGLTHATDDRLMPYQDRIGKGQAWLRETPSEPMSMTSFDGLKLRARYYAHPDPRGVLVACHGYRSCGFRDFSSAMRFYHDHRLSILLIDQRACADSEGKYITFGVRESVDVRDWCRLMQKLHPELPILAAGISLGASSVLMTADDLPENVAALIADCGFDNPWGECRYVARHFLHPAAVILLPGMDLFCRLICGFGLRERSASGSLSRCERPVFFVHGEVDELVPFENSVKNRAACAGPSVLFTVPEADHGLSFLLDTDGYRAALDDFLQTYVFNESETTAPLR